jgi:hypothetical protein
MKKIVTVLKTLYFLPIIYKLLLYINYVLLYYYQLLIFLTSFIITGVNITIDLHDSLIN